MENRELEYGILEYLRKNGSTNTFKLAHVLEIERDKLLKILKNLEEEGLVKITTGKAEFLSYPSKERVKKKPKISKKSEIEKLQEEKENQKLYIEKLKDQVKKLEQRPPKVITRTIIKEAKPIKTKQKKEKKEEKIKEEETTPKKIVKGIIKLSKKSKNVFGIKKSFKKLSGLKIKERIKEGWGILKSKNLYDFITYLKNLKRR